MEINKQHYYENNEKLSRMGLKQCRKCGKILPLKSFSKLSVNKDGKNNYCKECVSLHYTKSKSRRDLRDIENLSLIHEENKKLLNSGLRKCAKCGKVMSISNFNMKGGRYLHTCKKCNSLIESARIFANRNNKSFHTSEFMKVTDK